MKALIIKLKNNPFFWVALALFIVNLLLLGLIWNSCDDKKQANRNSHKKAFFEDPKQANSFFKKKLNLDDNQILLFEKMKRNNMKETGLMDKEIARNRELLFKIRTKQITTTSNEDSVLEVILLKNRALELSRLNHFEALRKNCRPEQQAQFDSLFNQLMRRNFQNEKTPKEMKPKN